MRLALVTALVAHLGGCVKSAPKTIDVCAEAERALLVSVLDDSRCEASEDCAFAQPIAEGECFPLLPRAAMPAYEEFRNRMHSNACVPPAGVHSTPVRNRHTPLACAASRDVQKACLNGVCAIIEDSAP